MIVLIILLSILFLWFIESSNNKQFISEQRSHIQQQLNTIRNRLENHTLNNIHLLKGLPSVIGLMPNLTEQQFANITQPLISGYGSIRNIGLAPNMIIKMVYPLKGNEKAIGLDYRTQELEYALIELARKKQVVILSGPIKLVQGGIGIIGRIPVFIKNNQGQEVFWGIISSVIDSHILYRNSGLLDADLNIHIALRGKNGQGASGDVFFGDEAIFYNHPII
ncbi:MAG: CHASE domain-containing protein, partial [Gammaproteobacteria bacterium]|nr:CHASE domain-containing protein [Gammaproteobacteria bacterium]